MYLDTYRHIYIHLCGVYTSTYVYVYNYWDTYIHTYMHICMYINTFVVRRASTWQSCELKTRKPNLVRFGTTKRWKGWRKHLVMNFVLKIFLHPECAFGYHENDIFEKSWDGERSVGKNHSNICCLVVLRHLSILRLGICLPHLVIAAPVSNAIWIQPAWTARGSPISSSLHMAPIEAAPVSGAAG